MVMQVTEDSFRELLQEDKLVVVDFWAEWCGPCKMIAPIVDELAEAYEDQIIVAKANVDENEELSFEYEIRNIPTLLFFKRGRLVDKHIGGVSRATLEAKIKALL